MAERSKIEWTDATWNPVTGCAVVSAGCRNCYAMHLAGTRLKHHPSRAGLTDTVNGRHVWNGRAHFNEAWIEQPLRWRRPRLIFVCAHGDLFYAGVAHDWINRVFEIMDLCPGHRFQVLTKRPGRMLAYVRDRYGDHAPGHIWLGTSVEDQETAVDRLGVLVQLPPAWTTFVSYEPALGPVDLSAWLPALDWVIAGGETDPARGDRARAAEEVWFRAVREQSADAGVPFFFKQWGDHDGLGRRVGKAAAGRVLDGRTHDALPGGAP